MWQTIVDKQHWNMLASAHGHAQFLQSWEWGEFQKAYGRRVLRLSWKDQVLVQFIDMPLPTGKFYWYCGRGPIEIDPSEKRPALSSLHQYLKKTNALFGRIDPLKSDFWKTAHTLNQKPIASTQPLCVRLIDITVPEKEYFEKGIHQKTRYNIRLSERKGVEIRNGEINNFLNLNAQTTERNQFTPHPNAYYIAMIKHLSQNPDQWQDCSVKIWEATYKGTVVASNIIIYFGDTMTYAHGASSSKHRNVMAPYLLRWRIIQDGIKRGYKYHDLGGVNPSADLKGLSEKNHPAYKPSWEGISQFKKGFGGNVHCYPESFDLIYHSLWYRVYLLAKKLRNTI
ncbi:MAG: hypothetical protein COW93_00855 [Parcubacteria group bacterium CG22_combo_CG10-13_8_21_14_all_41_9]|nr:MAG: hypothetical protein COW93_00855 [Parcubacteria group bacterium CG22_combo_CG10-13_8_21_14_all_41_9]